ncbi:hypothetical protein BDV98DRAFT_269386 [Pterulicium gracile]|uniref:Uncharacterized protein n=1 Tax=Pterulicium gracile TaxID=1884261 RepID=A0A5C3Q897_9AGAR|nr:hypothetical protein BDV98DRAFT_269386 [Pterula gracilis]
MYNAAGNSCNLCSHNSRALLIFDVKDNWGDDDDSVTSSEYPSANPMTLPNLRTLSVGSAHVAHRRLFQLFVDILAPALQSLSCLRISPSLLALVEGFLSCSGCKLDHIELHSDGINNDDDESLVRFLTSTCSSLDFIHSLALCPDGETRPIWGPDGHFTQSNVCGNKRNRILDLLYESNGQGSMSFFPRLRSLERQRMTLPANLVIDMLHARCHPGLPAQLVSCTLSSTWSSHRKYNPRDLKDDIVRSATRSVQHYGSAGQRLQLTGENLHAPMGNRKLTWGEGLEREPAQMKRLEELQEGGLEVWL